MKKIDCHVHFVGGGTAQSGTWFTLKTWWDRLQARLMLKGCGIEPSAMHDDLDVIYGDRLLKLIKDSSLDALVLLAQDIAHADDGTPLPDKSKFYVPNDVVLELGRRHEEIIPAVSIHPGRADAMDELERCIESGARVLKLLPNVINIDCNDKKYAPFWTRMAEGKVIFLSHTGGEMTLPVMNKAYADPRILTLPLECGVTCIAAHSAGGSFPGDKDYTDDLLEMFKEFPNLYGDNSALCSLNRNKTIGKILDPDVQERILHGSDYPVPISGLGVWLKGFLPWKDWRKWKGCQNILEQDYQYKKAMGFNEGTFTRLSQLLDVN